MQQTVVFDLDLIRRYDKAGPRYTSYPTAVQFHEGFGPDDYRTWCDKTNALSRASAKPTPLSLYFHIPFCDTVCFYCGCNKVVTKRREKASPYLERVHKEIAMHAALFDDNRVVEQLHWGGGTPTFISHDEMRELMRVTREHFTLCDDDTGEYSIEIDPREVSEETIALLRELGFNRMSFGVQDVDPQVQKAVNRIQPNEVTLAAVQNARKYGFKSLSIDLIYGLPFQNTERFDKTLDWVINVASPDRLSMFNYAHLPEMFKPQRRINAEDLPSANEKLNILHHAINKLTDAGYVYIGMDHFARPDDELAVAQREGSLYRNFQGYSTHADCDLIAIGSTSIGKVGNTYSQNVKTLEEYYERIDAGQLPVYRGIELNADDLLRREVITQLICHFELHMDRIEKQFNINFDEYFAVELQEITQMQGDGLVSISGRCIEVKPVGHLLIRNICMVFDRYLRNNTEKRFSKVI
ncbi:MAG: oxygen-independent coproporphyrinogen III oxidase [Gammaproteobacteria bacterium]|nr:oxygen-independent coproporphyrinogen III oxidase [Gammaproteobacteria bacterium]